MARRFSRYKFAINALRTSEDQVNVSLPDGSPLAEYQKYVKGEKLVSYDRAEDSLPKKFDRIGIRPFGMAASVENIIPVPFSDRAKSAGDVSTMIAKANHVDSADALLIRRGFQAAKAIISVPGSGADTPERSSITNRRYKKRDKKSYTIPYGQKTTATPELEVRDEIRAAVESIDAKEIRVNFVSENL